MYELGLYIKEYYKEKNILPISYDRNKLYASSTDTDRTLISAYTFLAGLYQPNSNQAWNANLYNWLPIPVHTTPLKMDPVIYEMF